MKTNVPQIFDEVERQKSRQAKVDVLRSYDNDVLRGILQINFNPDIKLQLPEGEPPFKKDEKVPDGYSETNLYAEFRRMYIWLDPNINVSKLKREQLFIELLEGIHWKESVMLCLAKDKKLTTHWKSLKEDIVREAFPNILPPPKPIEVKVKEEAPKKSEVSLNDLPVSSNETKPKKTNQKKTG